MVGCTYSWLLGTYNLTKPHLVDLNLFFQDEPLFDIKAYDPDRGINSNITYTLLRVITLQEPISLYLGYCTVLQFQVRNSYKLKMFGYSHLSNKREVTPTGFEKKIPPSTHISILHI